MVQLEPQISPACRLTLKETAKVLGVHVNSIRNYTLKGLLKCEFHCTNKRFYKGSEIIRFWRKCY